MCNKCVTKSAFGNPVYYRSPDQKCNQCDEKAKVILFVLVFAFAILIAARLMMWVAKKGKNFGSVRILIDYFQILFIFGSFKLQWPAATAAQMQFFSFAMFNPEMAKPDCLDPSFGYLEKFTMMMLTPIIFIGVLALSSIIMTPPFNAPILYVINIFRGWKNKELVTIQTTWNMEIYKKNAKQAITASNLFLQFAFASLVGWSLGFFNCNKINDNFVSEKEPSLVCGGDTHAKLAPLATFGIIAYMGGIPLWLCGLFYFQRQKRFKGATMTYLKEVAAGILKSENCSFNYEHHWFIVIQMLTKTILIFAQMYFKTFNVLQGLFVQIALLLYTGFLLYLKPYKSKNDNIVDMAAQVSSIVTLCAGILFYNAKSEGVRGLEALGGVVVAVVWCSIIGIIIIIGYDIRTKRREAAEARAAAKSAGEDGGKKGGKLSKLKDAAAKKMKIEKSNNVEAQKDGF
eukprot:NODE_338_length_9271_cov_0.444178.p3 type:complete len:458 gc:universal NODE_338_length_9271_cov_0.444178:4230-5603(+)